MPRRLFFTKPRLVAAFGLALLAGAACSAGADLNISSCAAIRSHIREYSDIGDGSDLYVWWRDGGVYWTDDIGDIPDLANTRWQSLYWLEDERC